jgi:multicomponent Na+:H+ antiporter subunit E
MGQLGQICLRLTMWFLLTNNLSWENIVIGVCIAFLLPRGGGSTESPREIWRMVVKILQAIPQAYAEAFEMLLHPHRHEQVVLEKVTAARSARLIFLEVFLITFTPKTIGIHTGGEGGKTSQVRINLVV